MFGLFKKTAPPPLESPYDLLFGDAPWEIWAKGGADVWARFAEAHEAVKDGRRDEAVAILRKITSKQDLESRHHLQAWHFLRTLGEQALPGVAKVVFGVVVEMPVRGGRDTLAAYSDGRARYINHSGKCLVWEAPGVDASVDEAIRQLIAGGQTLANAIGPWDKPRLPAPSGTVARISLLTPGGVHFGQGPVELFGADQMAQSVLRPAAVLLTILVRKA